MIDLKKCKDELAKVNNIDINKLLEVADDKAVADILNQIRDDVLVSKGKISRDDFVGDWFLVIIAIGSLEDAVIRGKWQGFLGLLGMKDTINYNSPTFLGLAQMMITDKLATQEQIDSIILRPGSIAEKVEGKNIRPEEIGEIR